MATQRPWRVIPRSGHQWVTVECPVGWGTRDACGREVEVEVNVQTYTEGEPDGHRGIITDYDLVTVTAPCGHTYEGAEEADALYEAVKVAVWDGE